MRTIIAIGLGALALSACSNRNNSQANSDANMTATDNMGMDQNMTADQNMTMDQNAVGAAGPSAMDANASTQEMMAKDRNTNDPDTNLANGL
jgi:hypothetical protein